MSALAALEARIAELESENSRLKAELKLYIIHDDGINDYSSAPAVPHAATLPPTPADAGLTTQCSTAGVQGVVERAMAIPDVAVGLAKSMEIPAADMAKLVSYTRRVAELTGAPDPFEGWI